MVGTREKVLWCALHGKRVRLYREEDGQGLERYVVPKLLHFPFLVNVCRENETKNVVLLYRFFQSFFDSMQIFLFYLYIILIMLLKYDF